MKNFKMLLAVVVLIGGNVSHAKSYTRDEVTKMVSKKKYPKLGEPEETNQEASMEICEQLASDYRVGFANEGWPAKIVTETSDKVVIEVWGADSKTTFTCKNGRSYVKTQKYKI